METTIKDAYKVVNRNLYEQNFDGETGRMRKRKINSRLTLLDRIYIDNGYWESIYNDIDKPVRVWWRLFPELKDWAFGMQILFPGFFSKPRFISSHFRELGWQHEVCTTNTTNVTGLTEANAIVTYICKKPLPPKAMDISLAVHVSDLVSPTAAQPIEHHWVPLGPPIEPDFKSMLSRLLYHSDQSKPAVFAPRQSYHFANSSAAYTGEVWNISASGSVLASKRFYDGAYIKVKNLSFIASGCGHCELCIPALRTAAPLFFSVIAVRLLVSLRKRFECQNPTKELQNCLMVT